MATTGTHTGNFFGIPPTHRDISFDTAGVYEIDAHGLVSASRGVRRSGIAFQQITGQVPGL